MSGVTALVGGQFGSEGKGLIAGEIAHDYAVHVRVGAANAGHTVYTEHLDLRDEANELTWEKHVVQQIPCAAYANPLAKLVLGPGALISPSILQTEIDRLTAWRERNGLREPKLYVDHRAHVVLPRHIEREMKSNLAERIGSTSAVAREGIGPAMADRVLREGIEVGDYYRRYYGGQPPEWMEVVDVVQMLHEAVAFDTGVLLEGTQGTGLSLTTGFYPYCTSRNTTAAGLAADCGLGPRILDRVIMVCRSYPIRVAGPSGPFYSDSEEIAWSDIGVDEQDEKTTVTKKVRRVATFSMDQVKEAAWLNSATEIAFTFADYLDHRFYGMTNLQKAAPPSAFDNFERNETRVGTLVRQIETGTGVPVTMVGTGPHSVLRRSALPLEVAHHVV